MNNTVRTHANKKLQTVKLQTGRLEKCSYAVTGRGGADRFRERDPGRKGKVQRRKLQVFLRPREAKERFSERLLSGLGRKGVGEPVRQGSRQMRGLFAVQKPYHKPNLSNSSSHF